MKKDEKKIDKWESGENFNERQAFQRYLRDSQKWQNTMMYIGAAACMILFGMFLVLVLGGL